MRARCVFVTLACAGITGCAWGDGDDWTAPGGGVPNRGTLVYAVPEFVSGSHPAWVTPDSTLAFWSWDGMMGALKLLRLSDASVTTLGAPCNILGAFGLVSRRDGATIYYSACAGNKWALRAASLPSGTVVTLDSSAGYGLALRPDDGALAYARRDSIVVLDLSTMQQTLVMGGLPILFSPDGAQLLMQDVSGGVRRLEITTGATQLIWQQPLDVALLAARWDAVGIRLLVDSGFAVKILGPGSSVLRLQTAPGGLAGPESVWSPDGDHVAYWEEDCIADGFFGGCSLFRRTVYVGNTGTGRVTALVSEDAQYGSAALLFSSDGRRIYYSVGGKLYVADVP